MNTRRNVGRRLQKEIANAGAPLRGDQVPLEENVVDDQAPTNPQTLSDEDIRAALIQLSEDPMVQAQDMMAQANRDVASRPHQ